jgi:flavin reductase ActVB
MSSAPEYTAVSLDGTVYTVASASATDIGAVEAAADLETIDAFRQSMRSLAAGVVMVTTRVGGKPWGLTISSCCSVSLEPPQLLVSLSRHTASCASILVAGKFGVSVLGTAHKDLAQHGAAPRTPKFIHDYCDHDDPAAAALSPMILGALCHFDCRLVRAFDGGDHALLLGRVERTVRSRDPDGQPLLYFNGSFHALGASLAG